MKNYDPIELSALIEDQEVIDTVNRWLVRGDGVAVYTNEDMSSADCGHRRFTSFGSDEAQFVEPPEQLPDFPGEINWRYRLEGVYRGRALEPASAHEFRAPQVVLASLIRAFGPASWDRQKRQRLVRYGMDVQRFAHGPSRVTFSLNVTGHVDEAPFRSNNVLLGSTDILVTAWTNDDGLIDVFSPFDWAIRRPGDGFTMTGTDPNLGATDVAIHNNSMRRDDA